MNNQDAIKRKKFDNRQLNISTADNPYGMPLDDPAKGFLIIPEGVGDDLGEKSCVQEHHNAGHALWYLSMAVHALIHGPPGQISAEKTKRITGHLTCLREFLPDNNPHFRSLVTELLNYIEIERPATYSKWLHFVYTHWWIIRSIAERYGSHDKCFPTVAYAQVSDLVNNRQWRKLWWWNLRCQKVSRCTIRMIKLIRSTFQKGRAK